MRVAWTNWSGSVKYRPGKIEEPESEEAVQRLVQMAAEEKKKVRVVGAGHSSSPLVVSDDVMISLKHFTGVENADPEKCEATVLGGTTVHEAGREMQGHGLAMHNTGDVDVQTLAGAIGTGTHGTGRSLQNLSSMLVGARLVTGTGDIQEIRTDEEGGVLKALRVALGTCGIFLKIRVKLLPLFELHRTEWMVRTDDCLHHLEELMEWNRNFDFYWYPRSDMAKIRMMNEPGKGPEDVPYGRLHKEMKGPSNEILPRHRELKFDEMEYALPAEGALECFQEIRKLVKQKHRRLVGWRVLYRTVKADDSLISPATGRDTVTISLHQNAGLPFWSYFKAIEPVFLAYGGRPHWGKKHTLKAAELERLYPDWNTFLGIRKQFDPDGVFLTPYMQALLGQC